MPCCRIYALFFKSMPLPLDIYIDFFERKFNKFTHCMRFATGNNKIFRMILL